MAFVIRHTKQRGHLTLGFTCNGADAEIQVPAAQAKIIGQSLLEGEDFDLNIDGSIWNFSGKQQKRTDHEKYLDLCLHAETNFNFRDVIGDQAVLALGREFLGKAKVELDRTKSAVDV